MTDWRDVVGTIETMAHEYLRRHTAPTGEATVTAEQAGPTSDAPQGPAGVKRARTPPTPGELRTSLRCDC